MYFQHSGINYDIDFPNLTSIGGRLYIYDIQSSNIFFPNLTSIGSNLQIYSLNYIDSVNFSSLQSASYFNIQSNGQSISSPWTLSFPNVSSLTNIYLQSNDKLNNLKIFPINIGQEDISKSEFFFKELNIKNLNIYFDAPITLAKKFSLRGVPTTILFNKKGEEFARIIGSIDFKDEKFINWLKNYN
jgi:thiol-disulfide isomerase/thioredoxin